MLLLMMMFPTEPVGAACGVCLLPKKGLKPPLSSVSRLIARPPPLSRGNAVQTKKGRR